jgi:hypothetical protein
MKIAKKLVEVMNPVDSNPCGESVDVAIEVDTVRNSQSEIILLIKPETLPLSVKLEQEGCVSSWAHAICYLYAKGPGFNFEYALRAVAAGSVGVGTNYHVVKDKGGKDLITVALVGGYTNVILPSTKPNTVSIPAFKVHLLDFLQGRLKMIFRGPKEVLDSLNFTITENYATKRDKPNTPLHSADVDSGKQPYVLIPNVGSNDSVLPNSAGATNTSTSSVGGDVSSESLTKMSLPVSQHIKTESCVESAVWVPPSTNHLFQVPNGSSTHTKIESLFEPGVWAPFSIDNSWQAPNGPNPLTISSLYTMTCGVRKPPIAHTQLVPEYQDNGERSRKRERPKEDRVPAVVQSLHREPITLEEAASRRKSNRDRNSSKVFPDNVPRNERRKYAQGDNDQQIQATFNAGAFAFDERCNGIRALVPVGTSITGLAQHIKLGTILLKGMFGKGRRLYVCFTRRVPGGEVGCMIQVLVAKARKGGELQAKTFGTLENGGPLLSVVGNGYVTASNDKRLPNGTSLVVLEEDVSDLWLVFQGMTFNQIVVYPRDPSTHTHTHVVKTQSFLPTCTYIHTHRRTSRNYTHTFRS